uniref:leucine-rich repeat domain-containing protein n=1 Tax=Acetatifactor sp. TaxID=1872090 RepID=UPI004055B4FF
MERKCRLCGASMVRTDTGYKCSFCANEEPFSAQPVTSTPTQTQMAGKKKKSPLVPVLICVSLGIILLTAAGVGMQFMTQETAVYEESRREESTENNQTTGGNTVRERAMAAWAAQSAETENATETEPAADEPVIEEPVVGGSFKFESYSMRLIIPQIFGKPMSEVTQEDLNQIRYLEVETSWIDESCTFTYSMADYGDYAQDYTEKMVDYSEDPSFPCNAGFAETVKTITTIYIDNNYEALYKDLAYFSNVNALCLDDYDYIDWNAFPNLTMVDCSRDDFDELVNSDIPMEQIEVLRVDGEDLAGIEGFTALKQLYLDYVPLTELEHVAQCTSLETLYCIDMQGYTNYDAIGQLKNLKSLYIDGSSDGLKDLSVIASFDHLENLTITETDILTLDFLKGMEQLQTLRIAENDELQNFEALADLTNLTHLEFNINSLHGGQPEYAEIGGLKNLKSLRLHTVYNLDFLYELKQLEELEIQLTFYNDLLEPIRQMQNLKTLTLSQCNSQFDDGFACLNELPNLQALTISKMEFEDPADGLFALPNLEELRITSSTFSIAPGQVTVSDKLKVLDLSYTEFITMPESGEYMYVGYEDAAIAQSVLQNYFAATGLEELYLDYYFVSDLSGLNNLSNLKVLSLSRCELTEMPDMTGCPMLEKLYLSDNQISDISFVTNLPELRYIDLEDCYVTDIMPLKECTKLEFVNIRNNPISSDTLTDVNVLIK